MNEIDQLFAGLAAHAKAVAEQRAAQRERRRLAANARRRRRYAIRKAAGTLPSRPAKPEPEPEYDAPTGCYCHTTTMPPCRWCEDGGSTNDEETP